MPDVAVIIPCYNVERFLPECLDSVLKQTHTEIRAYAVDDCSSDGTAQVIREYAARDSRIVGIFLEKNGGVSAARNAGLKQAAEPWCIFVDGDDALPETAVEELLKLQKETAADFVCANTMRVSEEGETLGLHYRERGQVQFSLKDDALAFLPRQEVFCTCWNKLFQTSALKDNAITFNLNLRHAQDTLFTHEYLLRCRPRCVIDYDKNVYLYRQRASSCVHAIALEKRLKALETLVVALDDLASASGLSRKIAARKAAEYMWAIRKFSANQQIRRAYVASLLPTTLFREHLRPVLCQFGKMRHRLLMRCIRCGWHGAIRFW